MNKAKQLIQKKGLTQGHLLDSTGLSLPTIQHIMTADDWPQPKTYIGTIVAIAKAIGVSPEYLISENNH